MQLITTHPIKKSDLGFHANLFGGKLLAWLDAAAAAYAMEVCDTPRMVTVKIDECVFKKPAKEGQLLKIYGKVKEFGRTSVTMYLECRAHNVYSGEQKVILSTNIKFVRIDENNEPIPISERVKVKYNSPKTSLGGTTVMCAECGSTENIKFSPYDFIPYCEKHNQSNNL